MGYLQVIIRYTDVSTHATLVRVTDLTVGILTERWFNEGNQKIRLLFMRLWSKEQQDYSRLSGTLMCKICKQVADSDFSWHCLWGTLEVSSEAVTYNRCWDCLHLPGSTFSLFFWFLCEYHLLPESYWNCLVGIWACASQASVLYEGERIWRIISSIPMFKLRTLSITTWQWLKKWVCENMYRWSVERQFAWAGRSLSG